MGASLLDECLQDPSTALRLVSQPKKPDQRPGWGNRIHNAVHNAFSFQPQVGAPCYFLRNQVINNLEDILKYRGTPGRAVLMHNTFVHWQDLRPAGGNCQRWKSRLSLTGGTVER